ncbi:MAG: alpha/beta hydrolase, partial [Bryobacterales bacterium]|nr:alpha/beta hydrolase [Bryobacterales bacterium]
MLCFFVTSLGLALALPGFDQGRVKVDGAEIAYQIRRGAGPALVLVPGSYVGADDWTGVVAALDPTLTIQIVEVRGHGQSWPPPTAGSIPQFAADVFAAAEHAGLKRYYAGGHSLGGMIAIEMAAQRPALIRGVISVEGWTHHTVARDAFGANANVLAPAMREKLTELRKPVMTRWTKEQVTEFGSIWRQWDGWPALEQMRVPVLELWGDRGVAPASREKMKIPDRANIELAWVTGASHYLPMERPGEVAAAINRFVLDHARVERLLADDA